MQQSDPPIPAGAPAKLDEKTLVSRLRSGDEAAYEALVRAHGGRLLAVARRFLRDEEDARDALKEAFLSAFRSIDSFEGGSRLSTWLHRILVNQALMKLRTRRRTPERSLNELLPQFLEDGHSVHAFLPWREPAEAAVGRREIRDLVRKSVGELPVSHRTVVLLRDIEGLDTEETARLIGISENAVKVRLHRARQALRALLDPQLRTEKA
jgi:RNA polymerase sigma-70 factor (ECF subfamily)